MASIVNTTTTVNDKKSSVSTKSNIKNEKLKLNRNLKPFNICTKSLNNNKSSLIHSANSTPKSINNLFKLTSPTTPTLVSPKPKKQNSFIYIHTKGYSDDSDSDSSIRKVESISTPTTPLTPRTYNRNNLNLLLKDIKALNFKYKNKNFFDSNMFKQTQENLDNLEKSLLKTDTLVIKNTSSNISNENENNNTNNNMKDINTNLRGSEETLIASSNNSLNSMMSTLSDDIQKLILKSPTPPPTTKLPDLPPPTTKLPELPPPTTKLPDLPSSSSSRPCKKYLPPSRHTFKYVPPPPLDEKDINLDAFDIIKTIGTGSFGRVHLVKSHANNKFYAMKAIPKYHIAKEQQIEHIQEEKRILSELNHPLFVQLLGSFQTRTHLFIITNYIAGGELFAVLKKKTRFINNVAKFYAAEVTIALDYLHSKGIVYRDLKPENIMLDVTGHIKLVDLGFAKHVTDVTYTLCGTPEYMAPEVILSKAYSKAVDWYALGILIYEMLSGYPPFYDKDQIKLYKKILSGKIYWPSIINETAKDLIKHLITPDITKRYGYLKNGAEDIKKHKWFANVEWDRVAKLGIAPPFIPEIYDEGDTRHFQRYSEPCDKEYYKAQDQEAHHEETEKFDQYFKDF